MDFNLKFVETGNWVLGESMASCEITCAQSGRTCNAEEQSMITTNELIAQKMEVAGSSCEGFNKKVSSAARPFRNEETGECAPVEVGSKSDCSETPYPKHRALCYCEGF